MTTPPLNEFRTSRYLYGFCTDLALAIHDLRGFPIACCAETLHSGSPTHCLNYLPDRDLYLDARGICTAEEIFATEGYEYCKYLYQITYMPCYSEESNWTTRHALATARRLLEAVKL